MTDEPTTPDRPSLLVYVPREEAEPVPVAPGWWIEVAEIDGARGAVWLTPLGAFLAPPHALA